MKSNEQILRNFAEYDLKLARQKGSMGIANTRHGLVEVRYDRTMGRSGYSVLTNHKTVLLFVSKKEALDFVMKSYILIKGE